MYISIYIYVFWGWGGWPYQKNRDWCFMMFFVWQMFHCKTFLVKAPPLGGFIVGRKQTVFMESIYTKWPFDSPNSLIGGHHLAECNGKQHRCDSHFCKKKTGRALRDCGNIITNIDPTDHLKNFLSISCEFYLGTLQETNISHPGKRKIIFNSVLGKDMLVSSQEGMIY